MQLMTSLLSEAENSCILFFLFLKAALSNTGIPKVNVAVGASGDQQPEVDISDEEFMQFDTSDIPVIVTLTKVTKLHF
jgi:uncharacterized protein (UPF0261 family)